MSEAPKLVVHLTETELHAVVADAVSAALDARARASTVLSRAGLAQALDVSEATIDRQRQAGMPHVRIGDTVRFELDRVLEWLRSRSQPKALSLVKGAR